jgi:hypothetical protein
MNWKLQTDEMVSTWTDMQKKMWNSWLDAVKGFGSSQATDSWKADYKKNLEAWEGSVTQALDSQMDWIRKWSDKVNGDKNIPESVNTWASQVQEMMKGWTEAQSQLWSAWFDSVKNLDPSQIATNWDTEGKQVLVAWQEAAQRAQEALQEWSKASVSLVKKDGAAKKK